METDKAVEVLKKLAAKPSLDAEEKEAVMTALGMLGWLKLSKSRMKVMKEKRDQSLKWE